jgi:hypothetical protein
MGAGALLGMPVVSRVVRRFGALHVAAGALVLASIPKLLLGFPLPAGGVVAVLVMQGFFGPLTGAPIFTVITTRTPAALRAKVLSAAIGLMFLTGPLGLVAAGPLINGGPVVVSSAGSGKSQIYSVAPHYQLSANGMYQAKWGINLGGNWVLRTRLGRFDIMQWIGEDELWGKLSPAAIEAEIDGLPIKVVNYEDLVALKEMANRPEDLTDLQRLRQARGEE